MCADAVDVNDDGRTDISDAVSILLYLFTGAPGLPDHVVASVGMCVPDSTSDNLPECVYESCPPQATYPDRYGRRSRLLAFCVEPPTRLKGGEAKIEGEKYILLTRDILKAVDRLTSQDMVSIVFFFSKPKPLLVFGDPPIRMDAEGTTGLQQFLSEPGRGGREDCVLRGMEKTFEIVNTSGVAQAEVIFAGDGELGCNEGGPSGVIQGVAELNVNSVPVNAIYTGHRPDSEMQFLEDLVSQWGGWVRIVGEPWDPPW